MKRLILLVRLILSTDFLFSFFFSFFLVLIVILLLIRISLVIK